MLGIIRRCARPASFVGGVVLFSASVLAGDPPVSPPSLPAVVAKLPADAQAAVIIPSLSRLNAHASQFTAAMEVTNLSSIEQLLTVMGIRNGLDFASSAAIVLDLPDEPGIAIGMTLVLPVTDYGAFVTNFGVDLSAQRPGISTFNYFGRDYFAKSLGGEYAIISESVDSIRAYEPSGDADAIARKIGRASCRERV